MYHITLINMSSFDCLYDYLFYLQFNHEFLNNISSLDVVTLYSKIPLWCITTILSPWIKDIGLLSHYSKPFMFFVPQVNNINQPLEISAISSPEQSSRSPTGPDMDQPPVLKRERPLELKGAGRYSSAPSSDDDDDDSGYPADSSSSR